MKVVILAGGKGTRLGLDGIPKALVPLAGVPLLERTIKSVVAQGFTEILVMTGHLGDKIEDHFGDGSRFNTHINYVKEASPLGTAGCFNQIQERLKEPFLVLYADVLMDVDLRAFVKFALANGGLGSLFAHPNDHPFDSDLLEVDQNDRIVAVHPKPHGDSRFPNLVSAALYVLFPEILRAVSSDGPSDWGRDVFPKVAGETDLYAYRSCEYVKDVGTPDRLAKALGHLEKGRLTRLALRTSKPALFLDRDGVINLERGGVHEPSEVALVPGTAAAIRKFNDAGIPVICVTNQPDLAKGMINWIDLRGVTGEIDHQLASESGAYIDDLLVCPHHPEHGWPGEVPELKVACDCRKPADGMLRHAAAAHNIDLNRSWIVGDRYCDVAAGVSAGAHAALVMTGHAGNDRASFAVTPDAVFADLAAATPTLLELMS